MSASVIKALILTKEPGQLKKRMKKAFFVFLFCALFSFIYELFSHGVYSPYMIFAGALPLLLGAFVSLLFLVTGHSMPGRRTHELWCCGIATLTVGCYLKGALEIYGTTNRLTAIYPFAGVFLLAAAMVCYLVGYFHEEA